MSGMSAAVAPSGGGGASGGGGGVATLASYEFNSALLGTSDRASRAGSGRRRGADGAAARPPSGGSRRGDASPLPFQSSLEPDFLALFAQDDEESIFAGRR